MLELGGPLTTNIVLKKHRQLPREELPVIIKADIRMMDLQAKKCQDYWQPPEAAREAWSRLSLRAFRGTKLANILILNV